MEKQMGMRPQDVVILLKMITCENRSLNLSDIAKSLYISASEVTKAMERNRIAGLSILQKIR